MKKNNGYSFFIAMFLSASVSYAQTAVIPKAVVTGGESRVVATEVDFRFDSYSLDQSYMGNAASLRRFGAVVDSVGNAAVKTVEIVSQSSPEGRYEYNKVLSERRAGAVRDYVVSKFGALSSRTVMSPDGESWGQLLEYVSADRRISEDGKARVREIVGSGVGFSEKKRRMASLGTDPGVGDLYRYLLDTYYPRIRNSAIYLVYGDSVAPGVAHSSGKAPLSSAGPRDVSASCPSTPAREVSGRRIQVREYAEPAKPAPVPSSGTVAEMPAGNVSTGRESSETSIAQPEVYAVIRTLEVSGTPSGRSLVPSAVSAAPILPVADDGGKALLPLNEYASSGRHRESGAKRRHRSRRF